MKCRADNATRQRIAKELQKGAPLSKFDIEARCFISIRNANNYLKLMHEAGEIHIAGYERLSPHGSPTTMWAHGQGVDAKKPKPKSDKQKSREYRARNPEAVIRETMRKRAQRYKEKQHAVQHTEVLQPCRIETRGTTGQATA